MKAILFLTGLLITGCLAAQPISYCGSEIDTIQISASSGGAWFGDDGGYQSTTETIVIVFQQKKNRYQVLRYDRLFTQWLRETKQSTADLKRKHIRQTIDNALLAKLVTELQINDSLLTFDDLGLSVEQWNAIVNNKLIHKEMNADNTFVREAEQEGAIAAIQAVDTFNLYLKTQIPTRNVVTIVTDAHNSFEIKLSLRNGDIVEYGAHAAAVFRQPWEKRINDTLAAGIFDSKIYNLKINLALLGILPKKFYLISTLDTEKLIQRDYVNWYLRRRKYRY